MNSENFYNMSDSGLTQQELSNIRAVFANYPQIQEAVLYGSRALGNYKPSSDIDLTLKGKDLNLSLQTEIEFDLDDLMLPYEFDISIFDKIKNPGFLDHIKRVGQTLYHKEYFKNKKSSNTLYQN